MNAGPIPSRTLFAFGLDAAREGAVRASVLSLGVDVMGFAASDTKHAAATGVVPLAALVMADSAFAISTYIGIRTRTELSHAPIIGLIKERTEASFVELFALGGDDLVSVEALDGLTARLSLLVNRPRPSMLPPPVRGRASVFVDDPGWQQAVIRALGQAGYEATEMPDAMQTAAAGWRGDSQLVVLQVDPRSVEEEQSLKRGCAGGKGVVWVLVVDRARMSAVRQLMVGLPRVAVVDRGSTPEQVLFVVNEAMYLESANGRASPRLLYSSAVAFRGGGNQAGRQELGLTYNVSQHGLYVRTLAPPPLGEDVSLVFPAPHAEGPVRVSGTCVWRKIFGSIEQAAVPPGFGVRLTETPGPDLDRFRKGYGLLLREATSGL